MSARGTVNAELRRKVDVADVVIVDDLDGVIRTRTQVGWWRKLIRSGVGDGI